METALIVSSTDAGIKALFGLLKDLHLSDVQFAMNSGEARRRLAYEELLMLELFLMREAAARTAGRQPVQHVTDGPRVRALAAALPFALTDEQAAALAGTIPYELLCNVNPRVPRIYTGRGGVTGTDPSCPA